MSIITHTQIKITSETATNEVNDWLDYKKIPAKKRDSNKEHIEALIDYICDGTLVINEDKTITQSLKFPISFDDGKIALDKIVFKGRLKTGTIQMHMQGVKSNDADGRLCAYVCALTSQAKGLINQMDTEDYSVATSITIFFL